MLQLVAMPHIAARVAFEANDDASYRHRVDAHRILPSPLIRGQLHRRASVNDLFRELVNGEVEWSPVQKLKPYHVQMDGVRIIGQVASSL